MGRAGIEVGLAGAVGQTGEVEVFAKPPLGGCPWGKVSEEEWRGVVMGGAPFADRARGSSRAIRERCARQGKGYVSPRVIHALTKRLRSLRRSRLVQRPMKLIAVDGSPRQQWDTAITTMMS